MLRKGRELLILNHATASEVFQVFPVDKKGQEEFVRWITKVVKYNFPEGVDSIGLLGCEVPKGFVETIQSSEELKGIQVKFLPPIPGSKLLIDGNGKFKYWKDYLILDGINIEGPIEELPNHLKTPWTHVLENSAQKYKS